MKTPKAGRRKSKSIPEAPAKLVRSYVAMGDHDNDHVLEVAAFVQLYQEARRWRDEQKVAHLTAKLQAAQARMRMLTGAAVERCKSPDPSPEQARLAAVQRTCEQLNDATHTKSHN